jgi:hypothetical protein
VEVRHEGALALGVTVLAAVAGITLITSDPAGLAAVRSASAAKIPRAFQVTSLVRGSTQLPTQGPSVGGVLYSVAATSADDVWAVGLTAGPALI